MVNTRDDIMNKAKGYFDRRRQLEGDKAARDRIKVECLVVDITRQFENYPDQACSLCGGDNWGILPNLYAWYCTDCITQIDIDNCFMRDG